MERKIGEIFEYNGEWYQCIIGHCNQCSFDEAGTCKFIGNPYCAYRNDKKLACFKKLEKVGETYEKRVSDGTFSTFQKYKVYNSVILPKQVYIYCNFIDRTIEIEIKKTKEDMEEKKLNLKPFDIQKAREGKPVCTRDGRKARIICFDQKDIAPIVGLVTGLDGKESIYAFYKDGRVSSQEERADDLMMLPEKKRGWINIIKTEDGGYCCKCEVHSDYNDAFFENINALDNRGITVKIEWED